MKKKMLRRIMCCIISSALLLTDINIPVYAKNGEIVIENDELGSGSMSILQFIKEVNEADKVADQLKSEDSVILINPDEGFVDHNGQIYEDSVWEDADTDEILVEIDTVKEIAGIDTSDESLFSDRKISQRRKVKKRRTKKNENTEEKSNSENSTEESVIEKISNEEFSVDEYKIEVDKSENEDEDIEKYEIEDISENKASETEENSEEKTTEAEENSEEKNVETEEDSEEKNVETEEDSEEKTTEAEENSEEKTTEAEENSEEKTTEAEENSEEKTTETEEKPKESVSDEYEYREDLITIEEFAVVMDADLLSNADGTFSINIENENDPCGIIVKSTKKINALDAIAEAGPHKGHYYLIYENKEEAENACKEFEEQDGVEYAVLNQKVELSGKEFTDFKTWGYEEIGFENIEKKIEEKHGDNVKEVLVGVLDTGIDSSHPLFEGRIAPGGIDIGEEDDDPTVGEEDFDPFGVVPHGTMVAGVIAQSTPEYVKIVPIKISRSWGFISIIDVYAGIEYAIEQKLDIINMSLSSDGYDYVLYDAVIDAYNAGVCMVAAYGNDYGEIEFASPACYDEVIAVTSVNSKQELSDFSSYGFATDVCAPGEQIYTSTFGGYEYVNGTSFSSPYTAAALAMIKAYEPELDAIQLENRLIENTCDLGEPGWDKHYGYGMVCFDRFSDEKYVAEVDGVKYTTFSEALEKTPDNGKITLWNDIEIDEPVIIDKNILIMIPKKHKISISRTADYSGKMFEIKDNSVLTLGMPDIKNSIFTIDGSCKNKSDADSLIEVSKQAKLVINNDVVIKNSGSKAAIDNYGYIELYGAKFESNVVLGNGGDIYLNKDSNIDISKPSEFDSGIYLDDQCMIRVNCELSFDVSPVKIYLKNLVEEREVVEFASGYSIVREAFKICNDNSRLCVSDRKLVINIIEADKWVAIENEYYSSLEEALADAKNGDCIQLYSDIDIDKEIQITKTVSIVAENESVISRANGYQGTLISVKDGGNLTLGNNVSEITNGEKDNYNLSVSGRKRMVNDDSNLISVNNGGILQLRKVYISGHEGNQTPVYNAGKMVISGATIANNHISQNGGAILNEGELIFEESFIKNNNAYEGGGICNKGKMIFKGGFIENNNAYKGGGISSYGKFEMLGGTISENTTNGYGGGICNNIDAEIIIKNGLINRNKCSDKKNNNNTFQGGGIYNEGKLTILGGLISENVVEGWNGHGGGIYNTGVFILVDGTVEKNRAGSSGGGISNKNKFTMSGGLLHNNILDNHEGDSGLNTYAKEIESVGYSHNEVQMRLIGGSIIHENDNDNICNPEIVIENSFLELGGDISWNEGVLLCVSPSWNNNVDNEKIMVSSELSKKPPVLYVYGLRLEYFPELEGYMDIKREDISITYADGLIPDEKQFLGESSLKFKRVDQQLILTDEPFEYEEELSGECGEELYWKLKDGILTIYGTGDMYERLWLKRCWERYRDVVKEINISGGTSISSGAFGDFRNLEKVVLSQSICSCGWSVFFDTPNLKLVISEAEDDTFYRTLDGFADVFGSTYPIDVPIKVVSTNDDLFRYFEVTKERKLEHYLKPIGNDYFYCKICDKYFADIDESKEIDPHTQCYGGKATCVSKAICDFCHKEYGELDPNNHEETEIREAKEATCAEEGYTGDIYCKACNIKLSDGKIIDKLEHKDVNDDGICDVCKNQMYKEGLWISDIEDQIYTGKAIIPEVEVYNMDKKLKLNKDYSVKITNNINAGKAVVTITGKGNYADVKKAEFNILPVSIDRSEFAADDIALKVKEKAQKPKPVLTWNGKEISANSYTYKYYRADDSGNVIGDALTSVEEAGRYVIVITGKGSFAGTRNVGLTLTDDLKLASGFTVKKIPNQPYTNMNIEPELTVKYGNTILIKGEDYSVRYENNVSVGTASAIITGINNYTGTKRVNFKITGKPITKATVEGIEPSVVYSGNDITFSNVKLYIKKTSNTEQINLVEGRDYTVSYLNNQKAGTATVLFTGINGYTGVIKKTFNIVAFNDKEQINVELIKESVEYSKGGAKPEVKVTFKNANGSQSVLKENTDYTLSYSNNTSVNDGSNPKKLPTVTVKLKGNFKGNITKNYKITAKDIGRVKAEAADKVYQNKKNIYKTNITLTDLDGKKLTENKDYSSKVVYTYKNETTVINSGTEIIRAANSLVDSKDIIPVGTSIVVTIKAKDNSNYTGEVRTEYRIAGGSISSAKAKIPAQYYTGAAVEPTSKDIKVMLKNEQLIANKDYEIVPGSYANNVKRGTASVKIRGIGNYGGIKKVTFTIKAKSFGK